MQIDALLSRLEMVSQVPGGWQALCPGHDDHDPSLTITEGREGRILVKCWAGCAPEAIVGALGWEMKDLFSDNGAKPPTRRASTPTRPRKQPAKGKAYPSKADAIRAGERGTKGRHDETWTYHGVDGTPAFYVSRFNMKMLDGETGKPEKSFRPIHEAADGWHLADPPGPLPLYRLPELAQSTGRVWLVEGEKAAVELAKIGLTVTTSAHGAKSAGKSDWAPLAGRDVVLSPDNDEGGEGYAREAAAILATLSPPAIVRVVRLPDLPPKGDAVEFLEKRDAHEPDDIRAGLDALADAAEVVQPPTQAPAADPLAEIKALKKGASGDAIERALRDATAALLGADPLQVELAADNCKKALKGIGVSSPGRIVDAAFTALRTR